MAAAMRDGSLTRMRENDMTRQIFGAVLLAGAIASSTLPSWQTCGPDRPVA